MVADDQTVAYIMWAVGVQLAILITSTVLETGCCSNCDCSSTLSSRMQLIATYLASIISQSSKIKILTLIFFIAVLIVPIGTVVQWSTASLILMQENIPDNCIDWNVLSWENQQFLGLGNFLLSVNCLFYYHQTLKKFLRSYCTSNQWLKDQLYTSLYQVLLQHAMELCVQWKQAVLFLSFI